MLCGTHVQKWASVYRILYILIYRLLCLNFLLSAVCDTLHQNGAMDQMKARMRAEVFHALEGDVADQRPVLSNENLLINELIREYLDFNMYKHSASVLRAGK